MPGGRVNPVKDLLPGPGYAPGMAALESRWIQTGDLSAAAAGATLAERVRLARGYALDERSLGILERPGLGEIGRAHV